MDSKSIVSVGDCDFLVAEQLVSFGEIGETKSGATAGILFGYNFVAYLKM